MKKNVLLFIIVCFATQVNSQSVTQMFFNLYTDSLKKGTNNYINVEGKLSNGSYKPLTNKDAVFTTSYGAFEGNDLVIPWDYKQDSCVITVTSKTDKNLSIKKVIYIQKLEDPELSPIAQQLTKPVSTTKKSKKKKKS